MKNKLYIVFVAVCLFICSIPFTAMSFAMTTTSTENKTLAAFPTELSTDIFNQFEDFFNDHFAFRNELVSADSTIQASIFQVSADDSVIKGTDGWLYYASTLDDYLGADTISAREAYNIINNLSLVQDYVESKGASFVFTVAPNKNSLYDQNMPYYYKKISEENNMTKLTPMLEDYDISYADLFEAFENSPEVLYLKRDSHWNNKGALLAYNTILDKVEYSHDNYETVEATRTKDEIGDLNLMLYPENAQPEWNYHYDYEDNFEYVSDTESVEDAWIETKNSKGSGTLLMYRDSFGNTLLPLMANSFKHAYFSKSTPYSIESYIEEYKPSIVVIEKVERNVTDFALEPPIIAGTKVKLKGDIKETTSTSTITIEESEYDSQYWIITGEIDEKYINDTSDVYVHIKDETDGYYEAYTTSIDDEDNHFVLYMKKDQMINDSITLDLIVDNDGLNQLQSVDIDMSLLKAGD